MSFSSQVDKSGPFLISSLPAGITVGFPFQAVADLLVLDTGPASAPYDPAHVLVLGSDYTLFSGGGYNSLNQMQPGSLSVVGTGTNAVAVNDNIVVMRGVSVNQLTSLLATGPLTVSLIEQALDKQATLSQQLTEEASRSLRFEASEFLDGTLPLATRINTLLGFGGVGQAAFYPLSVASGNTNIATGSLVVPNGANTARTLGALFGDILSVKDFGATGNGTTNDTAAIQACINAVVAAGGGTVFIPAGDYLVTPSTLLFNATGIALIIQGAGMYATTLTVPSFGTNSQWVLKTNLAQSNTTNFCLRDLAISGPGGSSPAGTGLYMGGEYENADIRNVYFNGLNTCLVLENIYMSSFTNLHFNNYVVGVTGTNTTDANDNTFSSCYFADGPEVSPAVAYPIISLGMGYNSFIACDFESSGYIKQVDMTGGSGFDTFVGCRWERCNSGTSSWLKVGNNQQYINSFFAPGGSQNCVGTANYLVLFPAGGQGNFTRVDINLVDYYCGNACFIVSGSDNNTVNIGPLPIAATYTNIANIVFDDSDSNTVTFSGGCYQFNRVTTWGGGPMDNWFTDSAGLSTITTDGLTVGSAATAGPHNDGYAYPLTSPTGNRRWYFGLNRGYNGYVYIFSIWVLPSVANQTVDIFLSQSLSSPTYQTVTLPDTGRWQRLWIATLCTSTAEIYCGVRLAVSSATIYVSGPQLEEYFNGLQRVGPAGYVRSGIDAGNPGFSGSDYPTPICKTSRWGTAAPIYGAFSQGEHVWNLQAAANGVPGWVCVAGGSPGTWKTMGVLGS